MFKIFSGLALVVALLALGASVRSGSERLAVESAAARVVRTSTLRCGYMVAPPFVAVDPNTKKVSGMNISTMSRRWRAFWA
jgi:hypothetical protein